MAISYVGGQEGGRAGATTTPNITFNLTGGTNSTPQAGDLVIITSVVGSQARNPAQAITTPTGYANLGQLNPNTTTYDTSLDVSWKFMGSTPDTTFQLRSTGNNNDAQSWTVQVFRGVDPTTPFDATEVPATGTATSRPNPGSITPVTAGAWVVICGGGAAATGANYTAPANFTTNFLTGFDADTNDSLVGSGYWDGWTSGPVDPAAYTGGSNTTNDSWAVYTLALRPAPPDQTLTQNTRFDNSQTFYSPTLTQFAPSQSLTPGLYTNTQTFYAATLTPGGVTLTASPVENTSVFYAATVSQGSAPFNMEVSWVVFDTQGGNLVNLLPSLLTNANTFYAHAVTPGPVTLTATRYDNAQTFYAPTVNRGTVTLQPGLYSNANTFYPATVTAGGVTLTPARYDNAQAFYAATVSASNTLLPALYSNTQSFYAPTVTTATALTASRFDNTTVFYQAVVSSGGKILLVDRYDNVNAFYTVTVDVSGVTLLPELYQNQNTFFQPTVSLDTLPFIEVGDGVGVWRKKRDQRLEQERREREQLRELIAQAIDPITEDKVKVVATEDAVAIVPGKAQAIAIPTFPTIDVAEVQRAVNAALQAAGIEAKKAQDAKAKAKAAAAMRRLAEDNIRKRLKRRREEELLLLM